MQNAGQETQDSRLKTQNSKAVKTEKWLRQPFADPADYLYGCTPAGW